MSLLQFNAIKAPVPTAIASAPKANAFAISAPSLIPPAKTKDTSPVFPTSSKALLASLTAAIPGMPVFAAANTGIPGIAAVREARRALDDVGKTGEVSLVFAGGIRDGADMAKALALGADAIAVGTGALIALNCNKDIPEADFEKELGVSAGDCYHCHTGRCPVGVATQDPKLRKRLNPDDAALRVYNYLHSMTLEAQLLARACGKTNIHSLEPEDLAALTMEASALAKVPLAGTEYTVGVDNFHSI